MKKPYDHNKRRAICNNCGHEWGEHRAAESQCLDRTDGWRWLPGKEFEPYSEAELEELTKPD